MIKKKLTRSFRNLFVLFLCLIITFVFNVQVYGVNKLPYNPKEIIKDSNSTIEGGRYSYDSAEIQDNIFKGIKTTNGEKMVFLTFDDGPSLDNTPRVLDILKQYGVKATFFVLGTNLDNGPAYEELLKRTIQEGHAIANHGYSHNYSYLYPGRVINYTNLKEDMNKSHDIMKKILGENFKTRVMRLPGGLRSWKGQTDTLKRLNSEGFTVMDWNALNGDAEGKVINNPDVLVQNAIKSAGNSNCVVLLMHDFAGKTGRFTAEALPRIIEHFKNKGYQFRTMY